MKRTLILAYGIACYAMFLGVFIYAIGFIGNFGVTRTLDGIPTLPFWQALTINLGVLSVFAIQHSGMARQGFKRWISRWIPASTERSTYVLLSNLAMILIFALWQPMGGVVWSIADPGLKVAMMTVYLFGWALVLVSTFLINHFHLFGLQQVWCQFCKTRLPEAEFRMPSLYRIVRHPLYVGWLIVFWAASTMTAAHLLFALVTTAYILIAIQWEERDLSDELGETYAEYKKAVPMIIPRITPKQLAATAALGPVEPASGTGCRPLGDAERS